MSYIHIPNLYKSANILMFRECFALEKIHGTSAHVSWNPAQRVRFSSGGGDQQAFIRLFDGADIPAATRLHDLFRGITDSSVSVFGEFYGGHDGKGQGMRATYGDDSRFVAFDVRIGDVFLSVPQAAEVATKLGMEFVHFARIPATLEAIDAERDADSVQAIRNGLGPGHKREGVVLRPLLELRLNNGARIIAKHKRAEFAERTSTEPRPVDLDKIAALQDAEAIAQEWVVLMRLRHVLDKLNPPAISLRDLNRLIPAMVEDVEREAEGEIVVSPEARTAIGRVTAGLFRELLKGTTP